MVSLVKLADKNALVECYHILVKYDFKKLVDIPPGPKQEYTTGVVKPESPLIGSTKEELTRLLIDKGFSKDLANKCIQNLENKGFLVRVHVKGNEYRTLHMDVAVRSAFLRTSPDGHPYIVSPRLALYEFPIPSTKDRIIKPNCYCPPHLIGILKGLHKAINHFFEGTNNGADIYLEFLQKHFNNGGLDAFQAIALTELLLKKPSYEWATIITAPTGSGKTEIFLLYALARILKAKTSGQYENAILVYPRKALAIDQAGRAISMVYTLNKILKEYGLEAITIGIRDGETPKNVTDKRSGLRALYQKATGERPPEEFSFPFRGIELGNKEKLVYRVKGGKVLVGTEGNNEVFDFIIPTREEMGHRNPDLLITNMWTLERRILDNNKNDINAKYFTKTGLVIIDETHEYTGLSGALVSILLRTMRKISENRDNFEVIMSSATVPNPKDFGEKISERHPEHIDFTEYRKKLEEKGIFFSGRRLVIMGVYDIMPKYSWSTYAQLWAVYMAFINYVYEIQKKEYHPKSLIFIENISEIRSAMAGFRENISLREPKDRLYDTNKAMTPKDAAYSYANYVQNPRLLLGLRNRLQNKPIEDLLDRVSEMHSELDARTREKVIKGLKSGSRPAVAFTTSSLELGVDYSSVSFILNAGIDSPISLRQRIGRGGRSEESMRTVLGIILTKKIPTESFFLHDPMLWEKLNPIQQPGEKGLIVSKNNPQVEERYWMTRGVVAMALHNKPTHSSGSPIQRNEELVSFLRDLSDYIRGLEE